MTQGGASIPGRPVAVIIPCYRVSRHILDVVAGIPPWVTGIFAVDDCCPEKTGDLLAAECRDPRVHILRHTVNQGVGGATCTGYAAALAAGFEIMVKMDGDGQMDPAFLPRLVHPIEEAGLRILQRATGFTTSRRCARCPGPGGLATSA